MCFRVNTICNLKSIPLMMYCNVRIIKAGNGTQPHQRLRNNIAPHITHSHTHRNISTPHHHRKKNNGIANTKEHRNNLAFSPHKAHCITPHCTTSFTTTASQKNQHQHRDRTEITLSSHHAKFSATSSLGQQTMIRKGQTCVY